MKSLVRKEFLNRVWGTADLDAVAEFWLRLYERAAPSRRFTPCPRHGIEIRLTGFPKNAGEELRRELERRAAASDLCHPGVHLHDPETLALSSEPESGKAAPPAGLGLPALAGPPFDGLVVEVRFRARGREGGLIKTGTATVTLVIIGELRNGELLVKSVWRSGSSRWEDDVYWSQPSTDEAAFMAGLEEFRRTGEVDNRLARQLFKESLDDHMGRWLMRLIYVPADGPRLFPLLIRVVLLSLLIAGFGWLIYLTAVNEKWLLLVPSVIFGLYVLTLFRCFIAFEISLLMCRHHIGSEVARHYQEWVGFTILTPHESEALLGDPAVRRYTAEIQAAGLVLAGDVASRSAEGTGTVYRIFRASDGASYFVLICQLVGIAPLGSASHFWPMAISFQAQTFFTSGGRVDSVTGHFYRYLRVSAGQDNLIRLDQEKVDTISFLRSHADATEAFAKELGLTPKPHESLEQYTRRQEAIHEEERQHFNDHPYTWSDHIRWYLQIPRREYRG